MTCILTCNLIILYLSSICLTKAIDIQSKVKTSKRQKEMVTGHNSQLTKPDPLSLPLPLSLVDDFFFQFLFLPSFGATIRSLLDHWIGLIPYLADHHTCLATSSCIIFASTYYDIISALFICLSDKNSIHVLCTLPLPVLYLYSTNSDHLLLSMHFPRIRGIPISYIKSGLHLHSPPPSNRALNR